MIEIILFSIILLFVIAFIIIYKLLNAKIKDARFIHIVLFTWFIKDVKRRQKKTYLMLNENNEVKIGNSYDPEKRIKDGNTWRAQKLKLLAVIDANIERYLHRKFKHLRINNTELFYYNDEIKDFINTLNLI